jgi:L-ascorbate metabolism protein UlaG (beta-lactamase superfamily)
MNLEKAAVVMVVHSHFDHSMDAPIVANLTGADLLGSESTANIGRGLDLPEQQIRVVIPGEPMRYGQFTVTFFISKHWPLPEPLASEMANQSIDEPLVPPARFDAYKEGKSYSILLQHPAGNLLIQGSAGYVAGALDGVKADAVFLSIGGLGDLPAQEQENYFNEIVTATDARHVYPIHWDTATTPLDVPLIPFEDFDRAMDFLKRKAGETGITITMLPLGETVTLDGRARSGEHP